MKPEQQPWLGTTTQRARSPAWTGTVASPAHGLGLWQVNSMANTVPNATGFLKSTWVAPGPLRRQSSCLAPMLGLLPWLGWAGPHGYLQGIFYPLRASFSPGATVPLHLWPPLPSRLAEESWALKVISTPSEVPPPGLWLHWVLPESCLMSTMGPPEQPGLEPRGPVACTRQLSGRAVGLTELTVSGGQWSTTVSNHGTALTSQGSGCSRSTCGHFPSITETLREYGWAPGPQALGVLGHVSGWIRGCPAVGTAQGQMSPGKIPHLPPWPRWPWKCSPFGIDYGGNITRRTRPSLP